MAQQIVELPDGTRIQVPSGTSDAELSEIINQFTGAQEAPQPSAAVVDQSSDTQTPGITIPPDAGIEAVPERSLLQKAVANVPIIGPASMMPMIAEKDKLGLMETAGGVGGAALGGIPGAMGGAAAMRMLRGSLTGEDLSESIPPAMAHGAGEAVMPGLGKLLKMTGRGLVHLALPGTKKGLETLGTELGERTLQSRGSKRMLDEVVRRPGMKMSSFLDNLLREEKVMGAAREKAVNEATERGATFPGRRLAQSAEEELFDNISNQNLSGVNPVRGANRVYRELIKDVYEPGIRIGGTGKYLVKPGFKELSPEWINRKLLGTKFVQGSGRDVPGANQMSGTVRTALSRALKEVAPETADILPEQQTLKTLVNVMDPALANPAGITEPRMLLGQVARLFATLKLPGFTGGKALARTGQALDGPTGQASTAAARAALLELLNTSSGESSP